MRKTLILVGLTITWILGWINPSFCYDHLRKGDTLFVWAQSGLNLRAEGTPQAQVMANIPYGAKVAYLGIVGNTHVVRAIAPTKDTYRTYPAYECQGAFIQVVYQDTIGYVFSEYLSSFPTLSIPPNRDEDGYPNMEELDVYLDRVFSLLQEKKDLDKPGIEAERMIYEPGIMVEKQTGNAWWSFVYVFPAMTLNEAYLMLNILWDMERQRGSHIASPTSFLLSADSDFLQFNEGMETCEIRQIGNVTSLHFSGGN